MHIRLLMALRSIAAVRTLMSKIHKVVQNHWVASWVLLFKATSYNTAKIQSKKVEPWKVTHIILK